MKNLHRLAAGCALFCVALSLHAQEAKSTPAPAAPKFEMVTYYFGLLTRGPNAGTGTPEEREKIQSAHLANIKRLHDAGKILVAGPFADGGEWRGIFIYKCASLAEAQELAATDPAVQAGRLKIEIHPWMTAKGYIRDPEFPGAGRDRAVNKLCIFVGTLVLGYAFWFLGEMLGFEFFGCFMLSGVGSVLGVWLGWKVAERLK